MVLSKFSENLKVVLSEKLITQEQLAGYLNTTQATVSRWVKGIHEPDYNMLLKICLVLGETPNSILGYDEIAEDTLLKFNKT